MLKVLFSYINDQKHLLSLDVIVVVEPDDFQQVHHEVLERIFLGLGGDVGWVHRTSTVSIPAD